MLNIRSDSDEENLTINRQKTSTKPEPGSMQEAIYHHWLRVWEDRTDTQNKELM